MPPVVQIEPSVRCDESFLAPVHATLRSSTVEWTGDPAAPVVDRWGWIDVESRNASAPDRHI